MMRKKIHVNETESVDPAEIVPEDLDSEASTEAGDEALSSGAEDYITALQAEIVELRTRAEESEKRVLYVQAEFQNFRRRKEDEVKDLQKFAAGEVLTKVLPIIDNVERAIAASETTDNVDAIKSGLAGTLKLLQTFLQKSGITPIESLGKEFDPSYHEAIGHIESDEYPPHTVAEEVQKGYILHDRVLRPALVRVTEG